MKSVSGLEFLRFSPDIRSSKKLGFVSFSLFFPNISSKNPALAPAPPPLGFSILPKMSSSSKSKLILMAPLRPGSGAAGSCVAGDLLGLGLRSGLWALGMVFLPISGLSALKMGFADFSGIRSSARVLVNSVGLSDPVLFRNSSCISLALFCLSS